MFIFHTSYYSHYGNNFDCLNWRGKNKFKAFDRKKNAAVNMNVNVYDKY